MARCYLGLGSNLGDRAASVKRSVELMSARGGIEVRRLSGLYLTPPWGRDGQPDFVNAAAEVDTDLGPADLLAEVKSIEREMGRRHGLRWGPREIDIDILLYGEHVVDIEGLRIPHPGIEQRAFVLVPLLELEPGMAHPQTGVPLSESLKRLERSGEVSWEKLTT